jgi:hypothetical protein
MRRQDAADGVAHAYEVRALQGRDDLDPVLEPHREADGLAEFPAEGFQRGQRRFNQGRADLTRGRGPQIGRQGVPPRPVALDVARDLQGVQDTEHRALGELEPKGQFVEREGLCARPEDGDDIQGLADDFREVLVAARACSRCGLTDVGARGAGSSRHMGWDDLKRRSTPPGGPSY